MNCGMVVDMEVKVDILKVDLVADFTQSELKQMLLRISSFMERVAEPMERNDGLSLSLG